MSRGCMYGWVLVGVLLLGVQPILAGIHSAPIILVAKSLGPVQFHPVSNYRLFRADEAGNAILIPFQIDEKDSYGDFILDKGPTPNSKYSNGVFDGQDELSIMGDDVGPDVVPTKWPFSKPESLYAIHFSDGKRQGAVYVGTYFHNPPPLSNRNYVNFDLPNAEIDTSRYHYRFDPKNYLVIKQVDIINQKEKLNQRLLDASTFYLKADLKYFLTFEINQKDILSSLDAYKSGPIRTIARVNFNYTIMKLNFDLGMYTEVSFFSNSVILPAVIDNPLDGNKSLNRGSLFYYGLSVVENPETLSIESNMSEYKKDSIFDILKGSAQQSYWLTALGKSYMIFMELKPSEQMLQAGNIPMFYVEKSKAEDISGRKKEASPLGQSPVNMAIAFDLTALKEGVHNVNFRLFVENHNKKEVLEDYKHLNDWKVETKRVVIP